MLNAKTLKEIKAKVRVQQPLPPPPSFRRRGLKEKWEITKLNKKSLISFATKSTNLNTITKLKLVDKVYSMYKGLHAITSKTLRFFKNKNLYFQTTYITTFNLAVRIYYLKFPHGRGERGLWEEGRVRDDWYVINLATSCYCCC